MIKNKRTRKTIAIFLVMNFLSTLLPYNMLYASNNGPNTPEALSFEPVDAADMVNLISGDLSYGLPLMNVPSPEGGYPLNLSYHSGVAMSQDASWVGLGWSLNPGALNRGVNGYPDDWAKTKVDEFFYDQGYVEDFYEFSIGGTLKTGVTIGLGATWNSNRGFGGTVTFGLAKLGGPTTTIGFGANGEAIFSVGKGFWNYSMIGSKAELGLGAGPLALSHSFGSGKVKASFSAMGITFDTEGKKKFKVKGKKGSASVSFKSKSKVLKNDYVQTITQTGINLDLKLFWFRLGKTRIKYSLFKMKDFKVSGIGYPYKTFYDEGQSTGIVDDDTTMDTQAFETMWNSTTNLTPSYDSYSVHAQGLSSEIAPRFYNDIALYNRSNKESDADDNNFIEGYLYNSFFAVNPNYYNLENNMFFYDVASNNSFLRVDRTELQKPSWMTSISVNNALQFYTSNTNNYSTSVTPDGNQIKVGNRKRQGNYIQTFTNAQIASNTTGEFFLEGMKPSDRTKINQKAPNSIGGYKITTVDGKTYHYTLPVYNYERVYKNFKDITNENKNFYELKTSAPFATHWLLTGVTGPDYFDANNNNQLDEDDYGYWVELKYGKWTDGYGWRTPKEGYNSIYRDDEKEFHNYTVGRKEIYYLDAVKTRTHTALFVKGYRDDAKSSDISVLKNLYTGGTFSFTSNAKSYASDKSKVIANNGDKLYLSNGQEITVSGVSFNKVYGKETKYSYIRFPKNRSLKLEKIILLKNEDSFFDRARGNDSYSVPTNGYFCMTKGFSSVFGMGFNYNGQALFSSPPNPTLQPFNMQLIDNVMDVGDIQGLNLEADAQKVIDFSYDYSLAKQTPNSDAANSGRLTLKEVDFKGRKGLSVMPPYKFAYNKDYINYNSGDEDIWGYHKDHPDAWSLNKITFPTGGEIEITYEADEYTPINNLPITFRKDMSILNTFDSGRLITEPDVNGEFYIDPREHIGIELNEIFKVIYSYSSTNSLGYTTSTTRTVNARIIQNVSGTKYKADLTGPRPVVQGATLRTIRAEYDIDNIREGGGIRVKDIAVNNLEGNRTKTAYTYEDGVTSYMPVDDYYVHLASEIISPGVMYENVTVKNLDDNDVLSGGSKYQFEVMGPLIINYYPVQPGGIDLGLIESWEYSHLKEENTQANYFNNPAFYNSDNFAVTSKKTLKDTQSHLGRLLKTELFNAEEQVVSIKEYSYYSNLDGDGQIGVEQESFRSYYKSTGVNNDKNTYYLGAYSRVNYPSLLLQVEETNNGFREVFINDKFDFLTGEPIETRESNVNGLLTKTKTLLAYEKYPLMGSKVDNPNNKNMLTQEAGTFEYFVNGTTNAETIYEASIQTWSDQWQYRDYNGTYIYPSTQAAGEKIWRKEKSYYWKGDVDDDGAYIGYNDSNYDNFNWGVGAGQTNAKWKMKDMNLLYDRYSLPLEKLGANRTFLSTKTGDRASKILSTGNARYTEMYFSSAEYLHPDNASYFDGEIRSTGRTSERAHMGDYSVKVTPGQQGFRTTMEVSNFGKFKISVWAHKDNYTNARVYNGQSLIPFNGETTIAGDWVMLNHYFDINAFSPSIYVTSNSGTVYFDDFRILPVYATMNCYVYNQDGDLSYLMDTNGLSTHYVYDDAGMLKDTYVEVADDASANLTGGFKLFKRNTFNYKNQ
jgi:hypothetical protein